MRYLSLAVLIAVLVAAGRGLEFFYRSAEIPLSIYKKSGFGLATLYLLALVIIGLFVKFATPAGFADYVRLYWARKAMALRGFLVMFGLGSLMVIGLFVLLAITGHLTSGKSGWQGLDGEFAVDMSVGVIGACLLAASEEIMFRGFLMRYLRWNATWQVTVGAVVVSSFIFALAHNTRDPLAWLTPAMFPLFVGLFILGILLAVTYLATGSLWCSVGLHAGLVTFGEAFLRRDVIDVDFSPWWLGGADEIRMAPLVWLSFVVTTIVHYATRRDLNRRFAIERPFVGIPLQGDPGRAG